MDFKKSDKNSTYLFKEYLVVAKIRGSHFLLPLDQHFTYIKGLGKAEKPHYANISTDSLLIMKLFKPAV